MLVDLKSLDLDPSHGEGDEHQDSKCACSCLSIDMSSKGMSSDDNSTCSPDKVEEKDQIAIDAVENDCSLQNCQLLSRIWKTSSHVTNDGQKLEDCQQITD